MSRLADFKYDIKSQFIFLSLWTVHQASERYVPLHLFTLLISISIAVSIRLSCGQRTGNSFLQQRKLCFYNTNPQRMNATFITIILIYGDYCDKNTQSGLTRYDVWVYSVCQHNVCHEHKHFTSWIRHSVITFFSALRTRSIQTVWAELSCYLTYSTSFSLRRLYVSMWRQHQNPQREGERSFIYTSPVTALQHYRHLPLFRCIIRILQKKEKTSLERESKKQETKGDRSGEGDIYFFFKSSKRSYLGLPML
jgi:hypothetical protein